MSHVKTAEAYSRLVGICTGFGGKYNPGRQTLQLKAMRALLEEAQSSLQDYLQKLLIYKDVTNEREVAYEQLGKLTSRIVRSVESFGVLPQTLDDVRYYERLIKGRKSSSRLPIPNEEAEAKPLAKRARTQQSYVAIGDHFSKLVQLVGQLAVYKPNEVELQVDALEAAAIRFKSLNGAVDKAKTALRNAKMHRDRVLYINEVSVVNNYRKVRSYVRSLFGYPSAEASQL
ncbi:MAG: hypothetical protein RIF39_17020, partial [Cyclobacteriaceae bacterium]